MSGSGGDALARESLGRRLTRAEAEAVQVALAARVQHRGVSLREVRCVAGAACASRQDGVFAAAGLLTFPALEVVEQTTARAVAQMPYVPGLRAFREGEALFAAIAGLSSRPDVVFFRGHGVAHPRGCGLASHLGLALGLAAIGCAQRGLGRGGARRETSGRYEVTGWGGMARSPSATAMAAFGLATRPLLSFGEPGDCAPLVNEQGRPVGAAVVTRPGARALLVSVGHLIDLGTAVALTLACSRGHVLPEPLRLAAIAAREAMRRRCP